MKFARTCIAVAAIIGPGSFAGQATPQPSQSEIDLANRLFQMGKFAYRYSFAADLNRFD